MECAVTSTQVVYTQKERNNVYKSDYDLDFWKEAKKRWMVPGVLSAVALAVLAPNYGAAGGNYMHDHVDYSRKHCTHSPIAILASLARPCAWLPLALARAGADVATLAATTYGVSFVFSPLAHLFLCGQIPLPSLRGVIITVTSALVPFALGNLSSKTDNDATARRVCALALLYGECCALLREAEGALYVADVVATLFLVISWLTTVAASSYLYVRCGLLTAPEAQVLLLVATPKCSHIEWVSSAGCSPSGLARLPAVFVAPAQALLLAALTPGATEGAEGPGRSTRGEEALPR